MIQAIEQGRILPGESIHSASIVYTAQISPLSDFLKPLERDSLHVVYERRGVGDNMMNKFDSRINNDLELKVMKNMWGAYKTQLTELSANYDVVKDLTRDFPAKKPRNVFYGDGKKAPTQNGSKTAPSIDVRFVCKGFAHALAGINCTHSMPPPIINK